MKLRDLEARFICHEARSEDLGDDLGSITRHWILTCDTFAEAHGIVFLCPKCLAAGRQHSIFCWFTGCVPEDLLPGPARWVPEGESLNDLSLLGPDGRGKPVFGGGCLWKGFVKAGNVV